jgi:predicted dehydrogenase
MVRAAIARGLHVMCEKPLTLDTAEARSLLAAARAAGITHAVNFSNRRNPAVQFVQSQLEAGMCGSIREIHLSYLQDWLSDPGAGYTWRNSRAESGSGVLGDLGSHVLDLGRVFAGEVRAVFAQLAVITPERRRADGTMGTVDADDLAYLQLRYANGAYGLVRVSRVARGRCDGRCIEIYGERASLVLEIDSDVNRVLRADTATNWRGNSFRQVYSTDPAETNWGGNTQSWIEAIADGRPVSPSFEDAVHCQEILDAAIRSDHEGRWIELDVSC